MIALIESSVVLRLIFGEPEPLRAWKYIKEGYISRLLPIEVSRVIDRARLTGHIDDNNVAKLHQESRKLIRSMAAVGMTEPILLDAAAPMPTVVRTLDAIHLATAIAIRRSLNIELTVATHDDRLALAAQASGFEVIGARE
ncbi:MAG: PIN domain-containing protein [Myxococcota bacterium]